VADVLKASAHPRVLAGHRRQVRNRIPQGLHSALLILRQHGQQLRGSTRPAPKPHLPLDVQHLLHFDVKLGVAVLHIIPDPVSAAIMCSPFR
jgi:hypothetical protein